ncbi:hypothetical protein GCM10029964_099840 [Kibdelosporangium lantanae]
MGVRYTHAREESVIEKGQLVAGRYRLLDTIGSGAMGVVWQARDERLDRTVAIKQLLMRAGLSDNQAEDARRRAMREGRLAARLQHRNAIALFDVAEHDGDPCLIMEYLPSRSLSRVLADRGTLSPQEAAQIGEQVATALTAAHAAGIVHRDVKPGNILIDDTGQVKITDFGISRAVDDGTMTQSSAGMLAGTPAYLAPEVARGQDPTRASDVFSLGATLYHAVEGQPPYGFKDNPLAQLYAVAMGNVPEPKRAGELTSALMRLLSTDADDRPTMPEVVTTLSSLANGAGVVAPPPPIPVTAPAQPTLIAAAPAKTAKPSKAAVAAPLPPVKRDPPRPRRSSRSSSRPGTRPATRANATSWWSSAPSSPPRSSAAWSRPCSAPSRRTRTRRTSRPRRSHRPRRRSPSASRPRHPAAARRPQPPPGTPARSTGARPVGCWWRTTVATAAPRPCGTG